MNERIYSLQCERQKLLDERKRIDACIATIELEIAVLEQSIHDDMSDALLQDDMAIASGIVTEMSTLAEKFELFRSLFQGRGDVFAKGYKSPDGKIAYSPVCTNLFNSKICAKSKDNNLKTKCSDCKHQSYRPMTVEDFKDHIAGGRSDFRDVIGSYPMDKDECCSFIVADFDAKDKDREQQNTNELRETVLCFYDECIKWGIPAHLEVSRSGYGVHVWVFFEAPVPAYDARKMLTAILTKATDEAVLVDFKYYDRFLPSQDTLPLGGLGNLIALPLQGRAVRQEKGNSLFVDRSFQRYPDQWAYFSQIKRMDVGQLSSFLKGLANTEVFGELAGSDDDEPGTAKPWERKYDEQRLSDNDFNGAIEVHKANLLYISTKQISTRAINRLRRLASFKNPKFYKNQAMRISTWGIPRVISKAILIDGYIGLPRGLESKLMEMLNESGVSYNVIDEREAGRRLNINFTGKLKPKQVEAMTAMLAHENGVLCAPPGFGKTVTAASIIAAVGLNTLVILDRNELLNQWKESLDGFLEINENAPTYSTPTGREKEGNKIGEYSGRRKRLSNIIDIATFQSLSSKDGIRDFIKGYGMVIVDECHHAPAPNFQAVLQEVTASRVYGLTATPKRPDGHELILYLECGPIRYHQDMKEQAKQHAFAHSIIPRFTPVLCTSVKNDNDFVAASNAIFTIEARNKQICADVLSVVAEGRNPIILTERVEHAKYLAKALEEDVDEVLLMLGKSSAAEKKYVRQALATHPKNKPFVLIATSKLIGEGFDCPRLDTLFLTMPVSAESRIMQFTGRLHREYDGKAEVRVYDYVDAGIQVLERSFYKRMRAYKKIGYSKMQETLPVNEQMSVFFESDNYWDSYIIDIKRSTDEIVISSPSLQKTKLRRLVSTLSERLAAGVVVTVVVKTVDEISKRIAAAHQDNIGRLQSAGIRIMEVPGLNARFTVIDQHILWYGGINPLGFTEIDDSSIRVDDTGAAVDVLDCVLRGHQVV